MVEIRKKGMPKNQTIDVKEVIGKKVLAKSGQEIGKVNSIHIDPETMILQGITLNQGMFAENDYIGKDYIDSVSKKGVLLKITPIKEFLGIDVFDSKAKKIGTVKEIRREAKTNNLFSIVVDRGLTSRDLIVSENDIRQIGKNVVLDSPVKAET